MSGMSERYHLSMSSPPPQSYALSARICSLCDDECPDSGNFSCKTVELKEYRREASDKLFAQGGDHDGARMRGHRRGKRIVIMKVSGRVTQVRMFIRGRGSLLKCLWQ
jgi:hypothetical protein